MVMGEAGAFKVKFNPAVRLSIHGFCLNGIGSFFQPRHEERDSHPLSITGCPSPGLIDRSAEK